MSYEDRTYEDIIGERYEIVGMNEYSITLAPLFWDGTRNDEDRIEIHLNKYGDRLIVTEV